jgi:hypothetical protein
MKNLIWIFLFILFVNSSFAQQVDSSCNYRNLMDDNWLKLRNQVRTTDRFVDMPAYDQGRTGTCYAFAATQLVDYWRQSRGFMPEPRISLASPIHMAMVYKTAMKQADQLDGGLIFEAVMAMRKYGICPKVVVNKDIKDFLGRALGGYKITGDSTGAQIEEDVVFTELTQGFIIQQTGAHGGDGNYNSLDPKAVTFQQYLSWTKSKSQRESIRKMDEKTLKNVYDAFMKYFGQGNYVGFVNEVLKSCASPENRIAILDQMPKPRNFKVDNFKTYKSKNPDKNEGDYMSFRKAQYGEMIRTLLNRKNAPAIGLAYCSSVLSNPGSSGLDPAGGITQKCGGHASILVGKREVNGKCQYMLKNSWNSPGICDKNGGCIYREVRDPKSGSTYKEEVGAWVDEENILNNLWFISYIYPESQAEKEIEAHWKRIEQKYIQATEYFIKDLQKRRNQPK